MTLTLQEHNLIIDNQLLMLENQLYRLNETEHSISDPYGPVTMWSTERNYDYYKDNKYNSTYTYYTKATTIDYKKLVPNNFIFKLIKIISNFIINVVNKIYNFILNLSTLILKIIAKIKAKSINKIIAVNVDISVLSNQVNAFMLVSNKLINDAKSGNMIDDVKLDIGKDFLNLWYDFHKINGLEYLKKCEILIKKIKDFTKEKNKELNILIKNLKKSNLTLEEYDRNKETFKICKKSINTLSLNIIDDVRLSIKDACRQIFSGKQYDANDIDDEFNKLDLIKKDDKLFY